MRCRQVRVRCTRCGKLFIRYDYGKGKRRMRRYKAGRKGYSETPHARLTDTCIICRGQVETLD